MKKIKYFKIKQSISIYFSNIFLVLLFFTLPSFGQTESDSLSQNKKSGAFYVRFADSLSQVSALAESDIANQTMHLLTQSEISPVVYSTDLQFENDYKIKYLESGCSGPKEEFAVKYNFTIFEFLNKHYGNKWRKKIRKDVIGLDNFKNNSK